MKRVTINADDFGLKSSVNKAIAECFKSGVITSTTLMANMPGFDEAVEMAHKYNFADKTGIHLVLTEGTPLTTGILDTNLFYNEFNTDLKKHKKRLFLLSSNDKKLIFNEFSSQIEKVRNAGIEITHIDTHHHIDEVWSVTNIILGLLKKYDISSMRILDNLNHSTRLHKIAYRKIVNSYIRLRGSNYSDFMGNQIEALSEIRNDRSFMKNGKLEIMVHPDYNKSGMIVDRIKSKEYSFDYNDDLKNLLT
jgi:chitin disaccharide deacetylase